MRNLYHFNEADMAQAKITRSFNSWIFVATIEEFENNLLSKGFEIESRSIIQLFGVATIQWDINFINNHD